MANRIDNRTFSAVVQQVVAVPWSCDAGQLAVIAEVAESAFARERNDYFVARRATDFPAASTLKSVRTRWPMTAEMRRQLPAIMSDEQVSNSPTRQFSNL